VTTPTAMTEQKSNHLPQALLDQVYSVLIALFTSSDFEQRWTNAINRFKKWSQGLPAPVSHLTQRLYLIQLLCDYFDPVTVKSDQNLIRIVLEGTAEENNHVEIGGHCYEVIRRDIGNNFGVAYTLKSKKGEIIRHEFFD